MSAAHFPPVEPEPCSGAGRWHEGGGLWSGLAGEWGPRSFPAGWRARSGWARPHVTGYEGTTMRYIQCSQLGARRVVLFLCLAFLFWVLLQRGIFSFYFFFWRGLLFLRRPISLVTWAVATELVFPGFSAAADFLPRFNLADEHHSTLSRASTLASTSTRHL